MIIRKINVKSTRAEVLQGFAKSSVVTVAGTETALKEEEETFGNSIK